jgi:hypothetical protein
MNGSLLYHDFANDLTIGTLCAPLGRDIEATENADIVLRELDMSVFQGVASTHLVRENGALIGICCKDDFSTKSC